MLKLNSTIKENILSFYDEYIITNFLKTIYLKKINFNFKKIVNKFKKKKIVYNIFFFSNLKKKIKTGYYLDNECLLYLSNNLIGLKKKILQKKIYLFEILFKIIIFNKSKFITRKINFKKKKKIKIKINKKYIGIIKNVVSYGIFIDIGSLDGLLHISDIPKYKKVYKNLFTKNKIIVKITKFDRKLKKISLNLKKTYKKYNLIFEEYIICKIKKIEKNFFLCLSKYNKIFIKKNSNFYKKNDIIKFYLIKKNENYLFLSKYYKLYKNRNKYIKYNLKLKFNEFYLFSYKNKKFISNKNNRITKIKKNEFYKYFISKIINNDFYKIIYINKKNYIKYGNFFLLTNINFIFTINNFKIINNNIFFFLKKY
ncbi:putative ribosomal protein S1 [Candidatus Carsonella ruddii PV]|uniref:Putative ribosomal protein S1 n=1 Tax=Carsonella ruddii (strain PV) TaxID=387662 RepID=Q05FU0_CARRP|nr:S1 RNA-binding domain-containing protein [Candidatus Carsonella ruddii]BAF35081.1 putative ribosomal protein S1 [Candidatus Carsonella ruddii PV]